MHPQKHVIWAAVGCSIVLSEAHHGFTSVKNAGAVTLAYTMPVLSSILSTHSLHVTSELSADAALPCS